MTPMDRPASHSCRCEVMQFAIEGLSWPSLSIEYLLDRLTEPASTHSGAARTNLMNEGT